MSWVSKLRISTNASHSGRCTYESGPVKDLEQGLYERGFRRCAIDKLWSREQDDVCLSGQAVENIAEVWGRGGVAILLRMIDAGIDPVRVVTRDRADGGVDISFVPVSPLQQLAEQSE